MTEQTPDWRRTLDDGTDAGGYIIPAAWPVMSPLDTDTDTDTPEQEEQA